MFNADLIEAGEEFLAHYGVEGMRWGIRKNEATSHVNILDPRTGKKKQVSYDPSKVQITRNSDGSISATGNKRAVAAVRRQINAPTAHPDHQVARETLKKPLATVSNKDLKDTNTRLSLEKQYSQLKYERSTVGKGKNYVGILLGILGTGGAVLTTYTKLADPKSQAAIKTGATWVSNIFKAIPAIPGLKNPQNIKAVLNNPVIAKRALNVARLAVKVVK